MLLFSKYPLIKQVFKQNKIKKGNLKNTIILLITSIKLNEANYYV